MRNLIDPNQITEQFQEAAQRAVDLGREAQERAHQITREAQDRALALARERANEARERAREAAQAMPPGLLVRLASSFLGIPLLIILVFAEGPVNAAALPFTVACAICAVIGGFEYFRGVRLRGFQPSEGPAFIAIPLLQFAAWSVSRYQVSAFLPALIAILVIATLIHQILRRNPEPIANVGATFLGVVYVGWLFSYLIFLRSLPGGLAVWPFYLLPEGIHIGSLEIPLRVTEFARGAWVVLYVMAVTWTTDAGAYFVGMRFGKTPLAPRLSPKKTREGAVGGIIFATLMSLLWGTWIHLPWWHCLVLGPVIGALGQIGDLAESALKRDLGIKDFGGVLPGHGGVLDRFDSLLFTAPVAYYYLVFVIPYL